MTFVLEALAAAWGLLMEASVYMLFGILVSGLLRAFLHPDTIAHHLGRGRFRPVFKAAVLGIPVPL